MTDDRAGKEPHQTGSLSRKEPLVFPEMIMVPHASEARKMSLSRPESNLASPKIVSSPTSGVPFSQFCQRTDRHAACFEVNW